jgi:hypothetical protein
MEIILADLGEKMRFLKPFIVIPTHIWLRRNAAVLQEQNSVSKHPTIHG